MTDFACIRCERTLGDVRLVEHGTDDMPLCKRCFKHIRQIAEGEEAIAALERAASLNVSKPGGLE